MYYYVKAIIGCAITYTVVIEPYLPLTQQVPSSHTHRESHTCASLASRSLNLSKETFPCA